MQMERAMPVWRVKTHEDWLKILKIGWSMDAEELHHNLKGESCVDFQERQSAQSEHASVLFGEISFLGASQLGHFGIGNPLTRRVLDFGMGLGKTVLQLFFQYEHLEHVLGVELVTSRFQLAADAVSRLYKHWCNSRGDTTIQPNERFYRLDTQIQVCCCMLLSFILCLNRTQKKKNPKTFVL